jgi:hypothetical protein
MSDVKRDSHVRWHGAGDPDSEGSWTPPEWGEQPEPHDELVTVHDGKVTEMVVYPNVDEALVAAGLNART